MTHQTRHLHLTYLALMTLLALTAGASFLSLGAAALYVSLAIAVMKAALVMAIFMQLRGSSRLVKLAVVFACVWVGYFYILAATDFLTR